MSYSNNIITRVPACDAVHRGIPGQAACTVISFRITLRLDPENSCVDWPIQEDSQISKQTNFPQGQNRLDVICGRKSTHAYEKLPSKIQTNPNNNGIRHSDPGSLDFFLLSYKLPAKGKYCRQNLQKGGVYRPPVV